MIIVSRWRSGVRGTVVELVWIYYRATESLTNLDSF